MPSGTRVDNLYRALLKRGYAVKSAVRIAQAKTGLALATGRPPRRRKK